MTNVEEIRSCTSSFSNSMSSVISLFRLLTIGCEAMQAAHEFEKNSINTGLSALIIA